MDNPPAELLAFNRGRVSRLGLARKDIERVAMSAETMTNWMPRTLGSMMLRPGTKYIGATASNNQAWGFPFIFGASDTAIIELTASLMRIWISDVALTRPSVSSAVANGAFTTDLTSWTDSDESGATSSWSASEDNSLKLVSTPTAVASRKQTLTISGGDQNVEHALRVDVRARPVVLRVGTADGLTDYIEETLAPGLHSLAFTPTGASVFVELRNRPPSFAEDAYVTSITIESSGIVSIVAPWTAAQLPYVRMDQSADVLFVACDGVQQQRIERRGTGRSWSIVDYRPEDGPFRLENVTTATMTGNGGGLTSSMPFFSAGHVGAIFELWYPGQRADVTVTAAGQWSAKISVTGVGTGRGFRIIVAPPGATVITLQRSFDDGVTWVDALEFTASYDDTYEDGLANQTVWYRIGCDTGDYVAGTIIITISSKTGTSRALCEVTSYATPTAVGARSLNRVFDDLNAQTTSWSEGAWSAYRGYPTAVALHEGRLWWAGRSKIWGSVSDAYDSFDPETEGDSGPISRDIGSGPVDVVPWLSSLERMIAGTLSAEFTIKSSGYDEPLTPTLFKAVAGSTQGSADVGAIKVDDRAMFVQRSNQRLYEMVFDPASDKFISHDLTTLIPEIGEGNFTRIAVQRKPDTRIHCVRGDGTAAVLVFDPAENVICWLDVNVGGSSVVIEDVVVLPATEEDAVYYFVKRTVNSGTVRYMERWALESDAKGPLDVRCSDSHIVHNAVAGTTITGLNHLEGETVVVWGWNTTSPFTVTMPDGTTKTVAKDLGTKVVTSGQITGVTSMTDAIVGLAYSATLTSTKLAALFAEKNPASVGLILADAHAQGLTFGADASNLEPLPLNHKGATIDADTIFADYDDDGVTVPGEWTNDARLILTAASPRPMTVVAAKLVFDE